MRGAQGAGSGRVEKKDATDTGARVKQEMRGQWVANEATDLIMKGREPSH